MEIKYYKLCGWKSKDFNIPSNLVIYTLKTSNYFHKIIRHHRTASELVKSKFPIGTYIFIENFNILEEIDYFEAYYGE